MGAYFANIHVLHGGRRAAIVKAASTVRGHVRAPPGVGADRTIAVGPADGPWLAVFDSDGGRFDPLASRLARAAKAWALSARVVDTFALRLELHRSSRRVDAFDTGWEGSPIERADLARWEPLLRSLDVERGARASLARALRVRSKRDFDADRLEHVARALRLPATWQEGEAPRGVDGYTVLRFMRRDRARGAPRLSVDAHVSRAPTLRQKGYVTIGVHNAGGPAAHVKILLDGPAWSRRLFRIESAYGADGVGFDVHDAEDGVVVDTRTGVLGAASAKPGASWAMPAQLGVHLVLVGEKEGAGPLRIMAVAEEAQAREPASVYLRVG